MKSSEVTKAQKEAYKKLLDLCDELVSEGKLKDAHDLLRLISICMKSV